MSCMLSSHDRRKLRVRAKLRARGGRLRVAATKTNKHIYVQLIDDYVGRTLVFASTNSMNFKVTAGKQNWCSARCAEILADVFCDDAESSGLKLSSLKVYFDRGPFLYTGVLKVLVETMRKRGFGF